MMSNKFDLFNILIGDENDSDYKNKPVIIVLDLPIQN